MTPLSMYMFVLQMLQLVLYCDICSFRDINLSDIYVTVSAKTRLVRTIKKIFFIHSALLAVSKEWITKVSAFCGV